MEQEQAAAEEALTVLRQADNNLSLVLRFLPSLFAKSPRITAQYAIATYPSVRPWNLRDALPPAPVIQAPFTRAASLALPFSVSTAISARMHLEHAPVLLEIHSDERWTIYTDYLEILLEQYEECCQDPHLVHEYVECALLQGLQKGDKQKDEDKEWKRELLFDEAGRPLRLRSHMKWKRDQLLLAIALDAGTHHKYSFRPRRLLELAKRYICLLAAYCPHLDATPNLSAPTKTTRYGHFVIVKELALRIGDVPTALEVLTLPFSDSESDPFWHPR